MEDSVFCAHIEDLFQTARFRHRTCFTHFLDLHQLTLARRIALAQKDIPFLFWGGYQEAERPMLGVFSAYDLPEESAFPITALTLRFREQDAVGHRDILGAAMALQVKRETIGDILTEAGLAVLFVTGPAADVLCGEMNCVGRHGVKVSCGAPEKLPAAHQFIELRLNISSLRLDCMVAALANCSREKAAQMVASGLVQKNGLVVVQTSAPVEPGDIFSLRGCGKFLFEKSDYKTKKGRLQIVCQKYS